MTFRTNLTRLFTSYLEQFHNIKQNHYIHREFQYHLYQRNVERFKLVLIRKDYGPGHHIFSINLDDNVFKRRKILEYI